MPERSCRILPLFALTLLFALPLLLHSERTPAASSVLIWPINPQIEADQKAAALWLENRGQAAISLQVRVLNWGQADYADQLSAQRAVVASPPVVTIDPGKRQMIRLMKMQAPAAATEQTYRVLVDELLPPDAKVDAALGVKFQMRYSVPLFVLGTGVSLASASAKPQEGIQLLKPDVRYQVQSEGGKRYLLLNNQGPVHARLANVTLQQGGKKTQIAEGLLGYVLPGARMRWELPGTVPDSFTLEARINEMAELQPISPH
ncbi:fimbrial chaperone protein [Pseudomonas sp. TE3786]